MDVNTIKIALTELDCSAGALAAICGLTNSRMSELLNEQRLPAGDEAQRIEAAVADMKALAQEYMGIPINFRNAVRIRKLLEERRQGPARELGSMIRELKIPFSTFVQLQFQEPISLLDANRVLNNAAGANPKHVQSLLRLAHLLRDYAQALDPVDWRDTYAVKATLKRWAEIEREHAQS
jgi:hypothetical protein